MCIFGTALDTNHALANGRQRPLEIELLGDVLCEAETLQPCAREQDRIESALVEPAQACIDITAQQLELQVRPRMAQLRLASWT